MSTTQSGPQNPVDPPLKTELETFERLKQELLGDEGKYAVISGDRLIGVFSAYDDALNAGYKAVGLNPILVKRIQASEPVNFFTRSLAVA